MPQSVAPAAAAIADRPGCSQQAPDSAELPISVPYHSSVKPLQRKCRLDRIVERKQRDQRNRQIEEDEIGEHIDAEPAALRLPTARRRAHVRLPNRRSAHAHDQHDSTRMTSMTRNGKRRAERPVIGLAELGLDQRADHRAGRAADQRRRDVVADRRHEDHERGGQHARHGVGQHRRGGSVVNGLAPRSARRFEQRLRDGFQRHIDRQDGERRVGVRQRDDDRGRRVEEGQRRLCQ